MSPAAGRAAAVAAAPASTLTAAMPRRVLLLGNPNTGKTTLFNRLCGLRAKTANFPGTTTELRVGPLPRSASAERADLVDLPGLYSLALDLPESRLVRAAVEGFGAAPPDAAIVVVDATNLVRNLALVGEMLRTRLPVLVALNMMDLARRRGLSFDLERLSRSLGAPVIAVSARRGAGVDALLLALAATLERRGHDPLPPPPQDLEAWAEAITASSVGGARAEGSANDTLLDRLDAAFTHPFAGLLVFGAVMAGLFWTIFALANVPMDLIEATFAHLGGFIESALPPGAVRDLVVGGLIGGVSGTVVFLPQICLLFFLITLLEDTGYLARAAFVMDRLLCRFGLPGQAFVPLLSSHACAIPGIFSARLIPDRHDRLATILVAPFMSCSARLPVYVLLTVFLFRDRPALAGLAFAACYLLGALAALLSALVARRTLLPGRSRPMVLELPTYKWPSLRVAFGSAFEQGWSFLRTVGTVILAISLVMWWLSVYPKIDESPDLSPALQARAQQEASFAGRLGHFAEPAFAPLGYDSRLTTAVLTSFAAREVFVSTLAILVDAGAEAGAEPRGVLERIHQARRADGTPLLTAATAASLLVFFVLAMQCLSTMVVVRRETRQWRWPLLQFAWMSGLAWIGAFVTYQGLRVAGIA